jgi:asparagine synthase (glutamine-hydrolysing)
VGGIVGKLSFDRSVTISAATVQRMIDAVAHRGAAAAGGHRAGFVGHGVALASCDDTPAAYSQVAHNESGTVRAVADADLSNAAPLRCVLEGRGHRIAGSTNAELIAHAYDEWGDACVERFSGPFAFAIWDEMQRRLLLARDRFGVRPLCFALLHGCGVVFGSEIKALLQDPSVGREWHPEAIDAYLAMGFVPAPITMYRRVSKLEPAHTLVVEGRRLTTRRYSDVSAALSCERTERETVDLLESRLHTTVASLADRRDACVLSSGGLASTAIAAMLPRGGRSVAVGVGDDTTDLDRLFCVAAHLGLRSETDIAVPDGTELAGLLARHFDEPIADPAAVSQYAVFVAARRYADLALTGHGAAAFWDSSCHRRVFDDGLRHRLYTRGFSWQVREANPIARSSSGGVGLPESQLMVADAAASAAGLRLRHPFLNRDLAELAFTLPDHLKSRGTRMSLLRQVVARHLPESLLPSARRDLTTPLWLAGTVSSLVPHVVLGERFDTRGIFSRPALQELWDEHRHGRRDHTYRLWSLLMLELWFREFIDGDAAAQPAEYGVLVRAA